MVGILLSYWRGLLSGASTLPETNSKQKPLKMMVSNRNLLFQGSIVRGELLVLGRVTIGSCTNFLLNHGAMGGIFYDMGLFIKHESLKMEFQKDASEKYEDVCCNSTFLDFCWNKHFALQAAENWGRWKCGYTKSAANWYSEKKRPLGVSSGQISLGRFTLAWFLS